MTTTQTNPESSGQALPAGTRIEEFVIERVLGSGGFGITYLARDARLNRRVVIKENLPAQFCFRDTHSLTVAPRHTSGEDADNFRWSLENFSKESAMLASLDHVGIVKVLRSFEAFGTAYFVMPFVEGVALDELMKQREGKPFTEVELRRLLELLLPALGHLHERGIYHRDIKPGNILISNDGVPALIDFGSARQQLSERSMTVIESPGYTPFEQQQSRGNVGPWSDLYALGGTLVKALTGEAPPKAMDRAVGDSWIPLAQRVDLSARYSTGFLAGIDRSLAFRTEERWQKAEEWLATLQGKFSAEMPAPEPERTQRTKASPLPARFPGEKINPLLWIIAGCVVLGLGVWAMIGSSGKVEDAAVQRERAAEQQRLAEAATVRAARAEERAARAEQEQQALHAHAKVEEEAAAKAEQERLAATAAKAEQQRVAGAAAKEEKQRVAEAAAKVEKQRLAEVAAKLGQERVAAAAKASGRFFTMGSTKDEVLAIQGTPDSIIGTSFSYGFSRVDFQGNRVSSWSSIGKNLKVQLAPTSRVAVKQFFTMGSTKDEVLAIQGTPDSIIGTSFSYGFSRVDFQGDKVSSWSNISKNLKVQLAPAP
jgi:predicted Ser/Thr protein kinase